ncbi:MAG: PAS domain S-box protein [Nitrospiraceae bacterium]|nr:MAG: PAS domain S-box protein [Nitrospiraceae bacterium]
MAKAPGTKDHLRQELENMRMKANEVSVCETELRKAQEKYEMLLDSAPDAMIFVDRSRKIIMANAQFEVMFGYDNDEIAGRDLEILIPERFRDSHRKHVEDFFSHPRLRQMGAGFELYAIRKNGEEFPVDISLSYLHVENEVVATAAIRDISKRKQMEEAVEMNYFIQKVLNSMLKTLLEPLPQYEQFARILDLILSVPHLSMQAKGAIYVVEEENPDVLVMKAHRGFAEEERKPCITVPFGKCLCGQAAGRAELIYADRVDDRHIVHLNGVPSHGHYCVPIVSAERTLGLINIFINEGHKRSGNEEEFLTAVAATLAGIIERNRMEQEKARLQEQLSQNEKLAALGRFTANVAHEIRNPLTTIGGFARRLDKKIPAETKEKDYAGFIISEVGRLEIILKNILSFSRQTPPQLDRHDIHEILDRVLLLNEETCMEKSIAIKKAYGAVPMIFIDKDHVLEAFENLVLNAIDSMPEGGTLTAGTMEATHEGAHYVCASISDTGMGIPRDRLDVIFEPFYTTKLIEKGTGLGLSITRKIAEAHGGYIKVQSVIGKGSTFILCFPSTLSS